MTNTGKINMESKIIYKCQFKMEFNKFRWITIQHIKNKNISLWKKLKTLFPSLPLSLSLSRSLSLSLSLSLPPLSLSLNSTYIVSYFPENSGEKNFLKPLKENYALCTN
jgi:hypothetical protein